MQQIYSRQTELRHLHPNDIYKLSEKLDINDGWKKLMEIIPKELNAQESSLDGTLDWKAAIAKGVKYENRHIRLIESAKVRETRLCGEILLDEWSISGKKNERPTVGVLLQLLVQAELYLAADFVAVNLLGEPTPDRPTDGPAARIPISFDSAFAGIEDMVNGSTFYPDTETLNENANNANSIAEINKDFYTKYRRIDKSMPINDSTAPRPPPRMHRNSRLERELIQSPTQSNATTVTVPSPPNGEQEAELDLATQSQNNEMSEQNLKRISALMTNGSEQNGSNINDHSNIQSTNLGDAPIPLVSLLMQQSIQATPEAAPDECATNLMTDNATLPVISALNLNGERSAEEASQEGNLGVSSRTSERSSSSSLSEDSSDNGQLADIAESNEHEEDDSAPNMEQRDSNNDSSLTSVTGTSGDNSFDLSTNDSSLASNDNENIPCVSALKQ